MEKDFNYEKYNRIGYKGYQKKTELGFKCKNYDLCEQDSISYKKVYLVMDLINSYQITNQNNNIEQDINNNFHDDTPPILV